METGSNKTVAKDSFFFMALMSITAQVWAEVNVERAFSETYKPGGLFTIQLEVAISNNAPTSLVVEDVAPEGWEVTIIAPPENSYSEQNKVGWTLQFEQGVSSQLLTYMVTVPQTASGAQKFHGNFRIEVNGQSLSKSIVGEVMAFPEELRSIDHGLVAWYTFDDPSQLGNDSSGNGNHGVSTDNVAATDGVYGKAAKFSGYHNPGHIYVRNNETLMFDNEFTFACFVQIDSYLGMDGWGNQKDGSGQTVFAKSHDRRGFTFRNYLYPSDLYSISFTNNQFSSPSFQVYRKEIPSQLGKWRHLSVVYDYDHVHLYLDGRRIETQIGEMEISKANGQDLYLGKFSDTWYPLNGALDDFRIYNRALSDVEIKQLYQKGNIESFPLPLRIVIDTEPDSLNAPWVLYLPDGSTQEGEGDLKIQNVPAGEYMIDWGNVEGWLSPQIETHTLNISEGEIVFEGKYVDYTKEKIILVHYPPEYIAFHTPIKLRVGVPSSSLDHLDHITLLYRTKGSDVYENTRPLVPLPGQNTIFETTIPKDHNVDRLEYYFEATLIDSLETVLLGSPESPYQTQNLSYEVIPAIFYSNKDTETSTKSVTPQQSEAHLSVEVSILDRSTGNPFTDQEGEVLFHTEVNERSYPLLFDDSEQLWQTQVSEENGAMALAGSMATIEIKKDTIPHRFIFPAKIPQQNPTFDLTVFVRDDQKNAVVGARVELIHDINIQKQRIYETTTGPEGYARFQSIPSQYYAIKVHHKNGVVERLPILIDRNHTINITVSNAEIPIVAESVDLLFRDINQFRTRELQTVSNISSYIDQVITTPNEQDQSWIEEITNRYFTLFPDAYGIAKVAVNKPLSWNIVNNLAAAGLTIYGLQQSPDDLIWADMYLGDLVYQSSIYTLAASDDETQKRFQSEIGNIVNPNLSDEEKKNIFTANDHTVELYQLKSYTFFKESQNAINLHRDNALEQIKEIHTVPEELDLEQIQLSSNILSRNLTKNNLDNRIYYWQDERFISDFQNQPTERKNAWIRPTGKIQEELDHIIQLKNKAEWNAKTAEYAAVGIAYGGLAVTALAGVVNVGVFAVLGNPWITNSLTLGLGQAAIAYQNQAIQLNKTLPALWSLSAANMGANIVYTSKDLFENTTNLWIHELREPHYFSKNVKRNNYHLSLEYDHMYDPESGLHLLNDINYYYAHIPMFGYECNGRPCSIQEKRSTETMGIFDGKIHLKPEHNGTLPVRFRVDVKSYYGNMGSVLLGEDSYHTRLTHVDKNQPIELPFKYYYRYPRNINLDSNTAFITKKHFVKISIFEEPYPKSIYTRTFAFRLCDWTQHYRQKKQQNSNSTSTKQTIAQNENHADSLEFDGEIQLSKNQSSWEHDISIDDPSVKYINISVYYSDDELISARLERSDGRILGFDMITFQDRNEIVGEYSGFQSNPIQFRILPEESYNYKLTLNLHQAEYVQDTAAWVTISAIQEKPASLSAAFTSPSILGVPGQIASFSLIITETGQQEPVHNIQIPPAVVTNHIETAIPPLQTDNHTIPILMPGAQNELVIGYSIPADIAWKEGKNAEDTVFYGQVEIQSDNLVPLLQPIAIFIDTDSDGMPDHWEVNTNLRPLEDDSEDDPDNDGLINSQEYSLGTNPRDNDSDQDGFNDYNEIHAGSNPLDSNSTPDDFETFIPNWMHY